jgi:hypothetical protein
LLDIKRERDLAYASAIKSKCSIDWYKYKELRDLHQKQSRTKLIDFFSRKTSSDFNNTNKFWKFYKNYAKTKNDNSNSNIDSIFIDNTMF